MAPVGVKKYAGRWRKCFLLCKGRGDKCIIIVNRLNSDTPSASLETHKWTVLETVIIIIMLGSVNYRFCVFFSLDSGTQD